MTAGFAVEVGQNNDCHFMANSLRGSMVCASIPVSAQSERGVHTDINTD